MAGKRSEKVSPTVRVHARTREQLRRITADTGRSAPDILAEGVDRIDQDGLITAANEAFAALRADPVAWAEELAEREAWQAIDSDWAAARP